MRQSCPHKKPESTSGKSPLGTAYSISGKHLPTNHDRPALVLIHGVGLNKAVWQPQVDAFSSDYRVIRYDMLGHGDSPLPLSKPRLQDYSTQLAELLEHLNVKQAHIIGHSMGALISIAFALARAHQVRSVIALNIVYQRDAAQRRAVLSRAETLLQSNRISGIEPALRRWFENEASADAHRKITSIRQWLEQANPTGYSRSYRLFALSDQAFTGRLNQLTMPVLYLTGEKDPNSTPLMSKKMAVDTPQGQAMVIKNEAHMMAYIHPDKINPVIGQFLDQTTKSSQQGPQ